MRRPLHLALGSRRSWRRIATVALLALQSLVLVSPVIERETPISRAMHTHDQQKHHARLHDDATCAICAARTQVAEAARTPDAPAALVLSREVPVASRPAVVTRSSRSTTASRAPPALS